MAGNNIQQGSVLGNLLVPPQQGPVPFPQSQVQQPQMAGSVQPQPGPDLGKLLGMLIEDRHSRHLGLDGLPVQPENPFGGPLQFQSAQTRQNEMDNHTGAYTPYDPNAVAQTQGQMANAGIHMHPQVGQVTGQQQPLQFPQIPQANSDQVSQAEVNRGLPAGAIPLGALMTPQGVGYVKPANQTGPSSLAPSILPNSPLARPTAISPFSSMLRPSFASQ